MSTIQEKHNSPNQGLSSNYKKLQKIKNNVL